jgi:diguanylate cyclase (GGDEF)-like protein
LGYEPHELVGRMAYELIHPNDVPTVSGSHEQQFEQRTIVPYRLRRKDGSYVEVETLSEGILDHNGHLIEIQCSTRDVTERNRLRAEKLDSERRLRTLVELLTDGVLMVDNNDVIVTANRAAAELLGHTELIGRPLNDVLPELRDNAGQRFKRNGRWLDVKASVTDDAERSAERVLQIVDVSSDVLSREELQRRAAYDQLTGLFNRESTMDYLSNGLAAGPVGVLFIDLNDFKGINDNQGHAAGDGCLRQVADRFKASLRSGDVIGRLGGDEFLVVLRDPPSDLELTGIAEKLCRAVSAPLTEGPRTVRLSASIGIARGTRRCEPAHLVRAADRAMYEAKRAGHDVAVSPTLVQPVT